MNNIDHNHVWHPYSAMQSDLPVFEVASADGVQLKLKDGRKLIDGMSSWWCMIHGYNHPVINHAIESQIKKMAHVMFGGLTHEPAIHLTEKLIKLTPPNLDKVFYSDSGSVAVEVAMKMAIQYWQAKGQPHKQRFLALRNAYHGDTFATMSVSDPETGMHSLFQESVSEQFFVSQPQARFNKKAHPDDLTELEKMLKKNESVLAAFIVEPIVQGAGGMWFYSADYLLKAKQLCEKYNVLFIADEIATGFGRTGKLFACEHANITPDIMCVGKALTGGYLTLAATITNHHIAETIDKGVPGIFMHGPTFMANPLACSAALASLQLLEESHWHENVQRIGQQLINELAVCKQYNNVKDVRVLGAIGVIEMHSEVDMKKITIDFVNAGVWIRPFGKLVYLMPPYSISNKELCFLTQALTKIVKNH